ncbi:single-stranded DNA-binding protein [Flavobacteriales bacterium]|jgi:single-strand DNA-binding protein|nr:single-stranded DNA-binding protein [Flavobacteriales bacterium]
MPGLNKVMLIGHLGKPPALRWLESGQALCKLSLATSERYKDHAGNSHERTEWHQVVLWRELAEIADRYLTTGQQVYIEGRLRTRTWQDANGTEHRSTEVIADKMEMLSPKGASGSDSSAKEENPTEQKPGPFHMDASNLPF